MRYFGLPGLIICLLITCEKPELIEPAGISIDIIDDTVVFAQIGDYGSAGTAELKVSQLVKSWNPDFIVSVGDNNYYNGQFNSIEFNISYFYRDFIYNFDAPSEYRCNGKAFKDQINRFFPTPGNHDANNKDGLLPYYNFFTLPGNEKYYKFTWGSAAFFSINSVEKNLEEQRNWLEKELRDSDKPFNIVFLHHPPYSSGPHCDNVHLQWGFQGANLVFAGHDHIYERIIRKTQSPVYIVNGVGGRALSDCTNPHDPSLFTDFCTGSDYGAVKATITSKSLVFEFYTISSPKVPVDDYVMEFAETVPICCP